MIGSGARAFFIRSTSLDIIPSLRVAGCPVCNALIFEFSSGMILLKGGELHMPSTGTPEIGFSEIELSWSDMYRLKKSKSKGIPVTKCETLLSLHLVQEEREHVPGYAGVPTGMARITEYGKHYLAYAKPRRFDRWLTRIIAIYGAITGTAAIVLEVVLHFL